MTADARTRIRIGVLPPNSNFIPFLAKDLVTAIETGSREAGLAIDLRIGSAGYNADPISFISTVQRLILSDQVQCIVAPVNVSLIDKAAGCFENQGVPLIALNLTEDPLYEKTRNPFVFVNGFNLWQSAWMSGYLAARDFGGRAAALVALHEGGYNLMFAFQLGLEAAGGELIHADVTHRNASGEDPTEAIRGIAERKPDFIWAGYSGKEAVSFLSAFESAGLKNVIPVVTIAPTVGSDVRRCAGSSLEGVRYAAAHSTVDENFAELAKVLGREPNPYARLAYESMHLIAAALGNADPEQDFGEVFPDLLRNAAYQSRGVARRFNEYSNEEFFNWCRVAEGSDLAEKVPAPPLLAEQYRIACRNLSKTGWINPYLCA